MATAAPLSQTTGRRKQPWPGCGSGPARAPSVNGRPFEEYFPSATHRMLATEPLRVTATTESYDIDATMDGGGMSGQAGALRLGIARALSSSTPSCAEPQAGRASSPGTPARRRARSTA